MPARCPGWGDARPRSRSAPSFLQGAGTSDGIGAYERKAAGIFRPMLPLESLFRDLNDRGGRYVVVGGLAVVLHGHLRATGDVDLVVDLESEQVARTLSALQAAGFQPYVPVPPSDFADPAKRAACARDKGMLVFSSDRPAACRWWTCSSSLRCHSTSSGAAV